MAAPAAASTTQQSLMQDDDLVLYRGPEVQASTLQRMACCAIPRATRSTARARRSTGLAYAMPLVVTPSGGGTAAVWGQLRFRANGAAPTGVQLQFRPQGSAD
jgi:hypothetical protein